MAKSAISRLPEEISEPTIGDMLAIDNIIAGKTMNIPFELLIGGKVLIPDRNETDQGITGNSKSIKACVDAIGSDTGTIFLRHSSGSAKTTYNLTTDIIIPSNITLKREPGAIINGTGKLTLVGIIGNFDRGQYFGSSLTFELTSASLQRFLFPEWWGIDGVADEVEINKALECAHTADTGYGGAADVLVSSGKRYNTAAPILMKHNYSSLVSVVPSRNAVIHRTMTTGNTLTIEPDTPSSNLAQHITVRGLTFYQTANVPTADAHIYMQSANNVHIEKCMMVDGYYGIYMLGGVDCKITDTEIKGTSLTTGNALHSGIYFGKGVNANADDVAGLVVRSLRVEQDGVGCSSYDYGINMQGADGIWIYESHIGCGINGLADVFIHPGSGNHCCGVYFLGCYFETWGVHMYTTHNAAYGLFQFKNCFYDGEGLDTEHGFKIEATCNAYSIQIHGCQMFNWGRSGIRVESSLVRNLSIQDNQVLNCDKSGGGYAGITLLDGVTDFSIIGNQIGDETGGGCAKSIVCGTSGGAGVSNCIVSSNKCQHNTDDKIYVYGAGGVQVRDNVDGAEGLNVASAATVTLPDNGKLFATTGTTNITSIAASWSGREIVLIFLAGLTFTDGSNLKLAGNFVTSPGATITLISNGTNWYEMARSVN